MVTVGLKNSKKKLNTKLILVCLLSLTGCAKLQHMNELLTLKALSEDQDRQAEWVKQEDQKFELLLTEINNNRMDQYQDKETVQHNFGEPILTETVTVGHQPFERWLYRYQTKFFGSPKVYFYFDGTGKLQHWEYFEGTAKDLNENSDQTGQTPDEKIMGGLS